MPLIHGTGIPDKSGEVAPSYGPAFQNSALVQLASEAPVGRGTGGDASGPIVRTIQENLVRQGFPVTIDGIFGEGTERAVINFQSDRGLTADGVVGGATARALIAN